MIAKKHFVVSSILRYIPSKNYLKKLVFEILGQRSETILQKFQFSLLIIYYQKMEKKKFSWH